MRKGDLFEWLAGAGLVVTATLAVCHDIAWVPVLVGSVFLGVQALTATGTARLPKLPKKETPVAIVARRFPHQRGMRMITSREEARRP